MLLNPKHVMTTTEIIYQGMFKINWDFWLFRIIENSYESKNSI